jgi:hypothetical protein
MNETRRIKLLGEFVWNKKPEKKFRFYKETLIHTVNIWPAFHDIIKGNIADFNSALHMTKK